MLDHDSPVPLHEQLTTILRDSIKTGKLTGRVPSIMTIAQEYQVGHNPRSGRRPRCAMRA